MKRHNEKREKIAISAKARIRQKSCWLILLMALSKVSYADNVSAIAQVRAHQAIGNKNQALYLNCTHFASITNNGETSIVQYVSYTICADNQGCDTKRFRINVGKGTWHDSIQMQKYVTYKQIGHYQLLCKTTIENIVTLTKEDRNVIDIY
jgi:hypothetical protein